MASRARELLGAATPSPWECEPGRPYNPALDPPDDGDWPTVFIPAGDADRDRLPGIQRFSVSLQHANADADAALIVYAVNRLPDYEAAVDALERLLLHALPHLPRTTMDPRAWSAVEGARIALCRFREPQVVVPTSVGRNREGGS